MRTCASGITLLALTVLVAVAFEAVATGVQPGWDVTVRSPTMFVGDPMNITVTGPDSEYNILLEVVDANGSLYRSFYPKYIEGVATHNITTKITDQPGKWRVSVRLMPEDVELAYTEVVVQFDELNFLSKRMTILERENQRLRSLVGNVIDDNEELHRRIDLFMLMMPIYAFLTSAVLIWTFMVVAWPLWSFLKKIEYDFVGRESAWDRLMTWFAMPYSPTEPSNYHTIRRLKSRAASPKRRYAAEQLALRYQLWAEEVGAIPKRPPVRPVRVVKRKEV